MASRTQQVAALLEGFASLRRSMTSHHHHSTDLPRITPSQWGVVMLIQQRGESSVKDIAHELHISSSAATQLIDGLVASGYVVREEHAQDRRAVTLTLSTKTKRQVAKMKERMMHNFLEIFAVLGDTEFKQYCALQKKIVERFSNKHNT